VARPGEPANLVWVAAADLPEVAVAAIPVDMATPAPSATPQVAYVYVPAPPVELPAPLAELPAPPAPTSAYLIPPATPAPRPVVFRVEPTTPPCTIRELGSVLRVCNGVTP
jgi:hypothetical protein